MPAVVKTIAETTQAITRPVVLGAIELLKQYTGIKKEVQVQVFTNSNAAATPGSQLDGGNGDAVRFDSHEKVKVDYTEEYDDTDALTAPTNWRDNVPVFLDEALQIFIRPVYVKATVNLRVEYRCPNEAAAQRWISEIRTYVSMERAELPMELEYSYQIPMAYMVILAHLHDLRERTAGYGQEYVEYLREKFDDRVTVEKTNAEKGHQFSVQERQGGILGWFDFSMVPQAERNDSNGTWTASFGFTFTYDKPISMMLNYPVVVHNQVVDKKYRKDPTPYTLTEKRLMNISRRAYESLPFTRPKVFEHPIGGFVVPSFDDWNPRTFDAHTTSVFTTLVIVDSEDPYQVTNLRDMGRWAINPILLEWVIANRKSVFKKNMSPFVIEVYTGDDRWTPEALYLDESLNLRTVTPLDERKVHHLRFAMVSDLTVLSEPYARSLCLSGKVAIEVLRIIDPTLEARGFIPRLRGGKMVAPLDWYEAVKAIGTTDPTWKTRPEYRRMTVGQFIFYTGDHNANI